ncbi:hypothetical protein F2P56_016210 [Juglans regia]|uniref:Reverse transcriptase domain-containing protein n=2 Tax=Juglans regia TaxID=51240 RepID=A0A834CNQ2_JUGRE|nr:uncharacterized protein LOC109021412 [Juglans regia]KAF5466269.1 hypothetical protein F2P56_016210 [Juglans regia]
MDVLSRMLEGVVDRGFISSFSVGGSSHGSISVTHLLFADDMLIFCDPDPDQIRSLRALLCFEAVSGLIMNLSQSEIVPVGLVNNLSEVAAILGCKVSSLPMKYLRLPLEAPHKSKAMWDGIVEKIECKLADLRWGGIASDKDASVADNMSTFADSLHLSVNFSRVVHDWEVDDIAEFYNVLYTLKVQGREDRLLWTCTGNKTFSVRLYYKILTVHPSNAFPWLDWLANGLLKAFIGELKRLELQVDDRFLVLHIAEKNKRALSQISLGGK